MPKGAVRRVPQRWHQPQTRFINEILGELTSRCEIDPACLYDLTFSDLAPTGPEDLFAEEAVDRIC